MAVRSAQGAVRSHRAWIGLLLAPEGPDGRAEQDDREGEHQPDLLGAGHDVAEDGDAQGRRGAVAQKDLADGVHAVGQRIELAQHLQPARRLVDREEDAGQEDEREDQELDQELESLPRGSPGPRSCRAEPFVIHYLVPEAAPRRRWRRPEPDDLGVGSTGSASAIVDSCSPIRTKASKSSRASCFNWGGGVAMIR
jgi:hypothetical protein